MNQLDKVDDQVENQVWDQLANQVSRQFAGRREYELWFPVLNKVVFQVQEQLRRQIHDYAAGRSWQNF